MKDIVITRYNLFFFFFKQKTAYEMRISDWSSDVCSSDLDRRLGAELFDCLDLVLGHQVAPGFLDADFRSDRSGYTLIVARHHDHALDAQRPEASDCVLCGSARRIHEPYGAQVAITEAHDHCRTTLFAARKSTRLNSSH